jgi:hypothetical protein
MVKHSENKVVKHFQCETAIVSDDPWTKEELRKSLEENSNAAEA